MEEGRRGPWIPRPPDVTRLDGRQHPGHPKHLDETVKLFCRSCPNSGHPPLRQMGDPLRPDPPLSGPNPRFSTFLPRTAQPASWPEVVTKPWAHAESMAPRAVGEWGGDTTRGSGVTLLRGLTWYVPPGIASQPHGSSRPKFRGRATPISCARPRGGQGAPHAKDKGLPAL